MSIPLAEVFYEENFTLVPLDWHVVIADVIDSTAAVNAGRHDDVNLVAAGSLVAALNVAKSKNVKIPYFFGGDGGTLIVPEKILEDVLSALDAHNRNSLKNFDLEMYIGSMGVKEIIDSGHYLKIAKYKYGTGLDKAAVVGDGLKYAEKFIKGSYKSISGQSSPRFLNLEGLECRWDKVKPPIKKNQVVCYLIEAVEPQNQIKIYHEVLLKMDDIFGNLQNRNPLSVHRLKLLASYRKIKRELKAKYDTLESASLFQNYLKTKIVKLFFKYIKLGKSLTSREYLSQVVSNADTIIVDGKINTIVTAEGVKCLKFDKYLSQLKSENKIIYGSCVSKESVLTCYIENRDSNHIHFVDGAEGGYTKAAKIFKKQFPITKKGKAIRKEI